MHVELGIERTYQPARRGAETRCRHRDLAREAQPPRHYRQSTPAVRASSPQDQRCPENVKDARHARRAGSAPEGRLRGLQPVAKTVTA